jgi:hypothetical protein
MHVFGKYLVMYMLTDLLTTKRSSIIKNWTIRIFDSYASETSSFLAKDRDQFSNPVGFIISANAEKIIDEIISNRDLTSIKVLLIDILKIRAVQEFTPSEAVGFIYPLKDVIKSELKAELSEESIYSELIDLYSFIDQVALIAFDVYVELRETVYRIRLKELRNKPASVVQ